MSAPNLPLLISWQPYGTLKIVEEPTSWDDTTVWKLKAGNLRFRLHHKAFRVEGAASRQIQWRATVDKNREVIASAVSDSERDAIARCSLALAAHTDSEHKAAAHKTIACVAYLMGQAYQHRLDTAESREPDAFGDLTDTIGDQLWRALAVHYGQTNVCLEATPEGMVTSLLNVSLDNGYLERLTRLNRVVVSPDLKLSFED